MSTGNWVTDIRGSFDGWSFCGLRKKPQQEHAQDLEPDYIEPYYPDRCRNMTIAVVALLTLVAVVVTVAVVVPKDPEATVVEQFLSGLPAYSMKLANGDPESPQAKALDWLKKDPQYTKYELHRLNQRYALAVFYHATGGGEWTNSTKWVTKDNECDWFSVEDGDICDEYSRLTALSLYDNALSGTIPMEMALLTNLNTMNLQEGPPLWVTVYSQLYVLV
jgi:hypothetical protein